MTGAIMEANVRVRWVADECRNPECDNSDISTIAPKGDGEENGVSIKCRRCGTIVNSRTIQRPNEQEAADV